MKQSFNLLIVVLLSSVSLIGQNALEFSHEPVNGKYSMLELDVELDYFSGHIQNLLVSKMAFGGVLDRESLLEMSSEMSDENVFGTWGQSGVRYRSMSDSLNFKKPLSLMLEFGMSAYGYSTFSKDAFHLAFLGNADRLGETMDLSGTKSESMVYQYAGLGLMNESTGSYYSFNLINVQNYFYSDLELLNVFTASDASEVQIDYKGEVVINDSLRGDFLSNSGTGVTLNGRYNFKSGKNNNLISIEVRNVGFASLNDRTQCFKADSTFNYSGINIDDIFSTDNPLSSITLEDSISVEETSESKVVLMPLDLKGGYYYKINELDHLSIGVRKRFFSEHQGEVDFNYYHNETEKIGYNIGISYGGYGGFRMNAGAYWKSPNWRVQLSTRNLLGAFIESAKGRSVSFGVSRTFRTTE